MSVGYNGFKLRQGLILNNNEIDILLSKIKKVRLSPWTDIENVSPNFLTEYFIHGYKELPHHAERDLEKGIWNRVSLIESAFNSDHFDDEEFIPTENDKELIIYI